MNVVHYVYFNFFTVYMRVLNQNSTTEFHLNPNLVAFFGQTENNFYATNFVLNDDFTVQMAANGY